MQEAELNQIKDLTLKPWDRTVMFRSIGLLFVLVFSLATGLAGGPRLHAMGPRANLTAMVICSEDGARTIYVDADGSPAVPASDCSKCPVCIALSNPVLAAVEQSAPVRSARRYRRVPAAETFARTRRHLRPQSRGPPPMALSDANPARANAAMIDATTAARDSTKVKSVASGMCHRFGRYLKDAC